MKFKMRWFCVIASLFFVLCYSRQIPNDDDNISNDNDERLKGDVGLLATLDDRNGDQSVGGEERGESFASAYSSPMTDTKIYSNQCYSKSS